MPTIYIRAFPTPQKAPWGLLSVHPTKLNAWCSDFSWKLFCPFATSSKWSHTVCFFYYPLSVDSEFEIQMLHILVNLWCCQCSRFWPFWYMYSGILWSFYLHFLDDIWCWSSSHMLISHLCVFFDKVSIQIFCSWKQLDYLFSYLRTTFDPKVPLCVMGNECQCFQVLLT